MNDSYRPEPGHLVRVRRYEVPCPELPGAPHRKLVIETTGRVLRIEGSPDNGVMHLDPATVAVQVDEICPEGPVSDHARVGLGYVFLGQEPGHGVSWTLETEVVSLDAQMTEYLAARDRVERLVEKYGADICAGTLSAGMRMSMDQARAEVDAMKEAAGEGGPGDPLCCQRYTRLHRPAFSVRGCRWLGWAL
jgi:hypothetical protein